MEEQPVALAISRRSPNSCVKSLMYGVSPQPAQAPENSKGGSRGWTSLTWVWVRRSRSKSPSEEKKFQLALSGSRSGACGSMLMALCFASLLLFTGQTSTQRRQPVQSSGETCRVYFRVSSSRQRGLADLKVAGALSRAEES